MDHPLLTAAIFAGIPTLFIRDDVDISNEAVLEKALAHLCRRMERVVVSLEYVGFMSVGAYRALYRAARAMGQHGQRMVIVCRPNTRAEKMLRFLGFPFEVYETVEAACAGVRS